MGVMKVKKDHYASRGLCLKKMFFIKATEFCFKSIEFFRNYQLIKADRLHSAEKSFIMPPSFEGGLAQLGERLHGMQEVSGSIPLSSTKNSGSPSSRGPGHDPFTVGTAVRIRLGTPTESARYGVSGGLFCYLTERRTPFLAPRVSCKRGFEFLRQRKNRPIAVNAGGLCKEKIKRRP